MHKISIITPSYNQGEFLEETITSILDQNYPNLEFIIIDGASTDNSVEIIKKYEKHLTYWSSEKDGGQTQAINKGLKRATGSIVNWINSDDTLAPNTLIRINQLFEQHPNAGLIHGKTMVFNDSLENKQSYVERGSGSKATNLQALGRIVFPQPSAFFKREVIEKFGLLNETLQYGMDYDLFVRIAGNYDIIGTDELFSYYRLHSTSKSTTSTPLFYQDWNQTFCQLLRSLPSNGPYIQLLKDLNKYHDSDSQFTIGKNFSQEDVNTIFYYYLTNGIGHEYEALNLRYVKNILDLTRKNCPKVYNELKFKQMHLRTAYTPKVILRLLRHFYRE